MKFLVIFLISLNCYADIKRIDGISYSNVCRNGEVFSVRYDIWGIIGQECKVLRLDGTSFIIGKFTHG